MAKHEHGTMDVKVQEKTFGSFISWVTTTVVLIIAFLIFLAIVNG